MTSKVSIIIPTYNHAHLIKTCLDSLLSQTVQDWEAIIINNYSKDKTIDVIESYNEPRFKLINYNNNGIIAAARNKGIQEADGEFIAFLDSDDYWFPRKLEFCLEEIKKYDIVFHDLRVFNDSGKSGKVMRSRGLTLPVFDDLLIKGNQIFNSSVLVKKALIDKVGGLSEEPDLFAIEDYDLWLRISLLTNNFKYLNEVLGGYFVSEAGHSTANRASINRIQYLYSKHIKHLPMEKQKFALALQNYIVTRQKMLCGDKKLGLTFLKNVIFLRRWRFVRNSLFFGIFSSWK
jgi:glycosyltransferase involved in cell wall biosynthesis